MDADEKLALRQFNALVRKGVLDYNSAKGLITRCPNSKADLLRILHDNKKYDSTDIILLILETYPDTFHNNALRAAVRRRDVASVVWLLGSYEYTDATLRQYYRSIPNNTLIDAIINDKIRSGLSIIQLLNRGQLDFNTFKH